MAKSTKMLRASLLTSLRARLRRSPTLSRRRSVTDEVMAVHLPMRVGDESAELLRQLVRSLPQALWIRDIGSGTIQYLNAAWPEVTGRRLAIGDRHDAVFDGVHPDDRERLGLELQKAPDGGLDVESRIVHPDGSVRWVRVRTFAIEHAAGRPLRVAGSMEDVTERTEARDRLVQLAYYDPLTGLPNRTLVHELLRMALVRAELKRWSVAVLFIDIDHFKTVNDTLGHAVGDELLRQMSHRLLACLRIRDAVGRLGGDEFVLVLVTSRRAHAAEAVAEKVRRVLARPFDLKGQRVTVSVSVGVAVSGDARIDPDTLIKHADAAMYQAKRGGRNAQRVYVAERASPPIG